MANSGTKSHYHSDIKVQFQKRISTHFAYLKTVIILELMTLQVNKVVVYTADCIPNGNKKSSNIYTKGTPVKVESTLIRGHSIDLYTRLTCQCRINIV